MRILNIHGVSDVRLDAREAPLPGDRDVVVQIKACGVCGSDLSYIKIGGVNRPKGGVTPLGHEASGVVTAVGGGVSGLAPGQRVVINPMRTANRIGTGGPEGAFSEAVLVAEARVGDNVLPIPDDLPFDVAALAEPLAVALHSVNRAQVKAGDKVAVFGCGPIGLGVILWLVDRGADVAALDLAPERLERARAMGARVAINPSKDDVRARLVEAHGAGTTLFRDAVGTDAFIDAAGAPNIVGDVIKMARTHARLVVTAAPYKPVEVDLKAMMLNELTITTALGYPTELPEVLAALPRIRDKAASLISHRFGFDDVLTAFATAGTPNSAKVMVEFGGVA
jgi:threonine dehydrogenase-like Zn-dependent dehydrogenase